MFVGSDHTVARRCSGDLQFQSCPDGVLTGSGLRAQCTARNTIPMYAGRHETRAAGALDPEMEPEPRGYESQE